ncbi:hypothetical protein AKJ49_01260 [candidate division MSBL1 archaeon SCGC-AAA382A03]|uniref:Diphthamide synthase domain-containing protein n=1 Tax=candidate division MSBL1 archaeon SCGC-AAA382A03 TaxID=1698278 RepID=A0A133VFI9_9EURY|nr:hypothetical protein AKJ49_01260 [candidate division MSBL1 archaeon SCGC-AAA382A03]
MTIFCSWSGGKESSLALNRVLQKNYQIDYLLTMLPSKESSVGHGLPSKFYRMQAESIDIEMISERTNWENYEENMSNLIRKINPKSGVFGDVYLDDHKDWVETKSEELSFKPLEPLWNENPEALFEEYLNNGFRGIIIKLNPEKISPDWLGKPLNQNFLDYLKEKNICPIGENGEYHTATLDGPMFESEIEVKLGNKKEYGDNLIIELEDFEIRS